MMDKLTNFDENLDSPCQFCNRPQRDHLIEVVGVGGEACWHHHPCDAQMNALKLARAPRGGFVPRMFRHIIPGRAA
jgi:hypothetical protein